MKRTVLLIIALAAVLTAGAQAVGNVSFEQDGNTVKIHYSLSADADISIYLSTDGGSTYESTPIDNVTGDVGPRVKAGVDKCAVWDVLADRESLQGDAICFKIHAEALKGKKKTVANNNQPTITEQDAKIAFYRVLPILRYFFRKSVTR